MMDQEDGFQLLLWGEGSKLTLVGDVQGITMLNVQHAGVQSNVNI